MFGWLIPLAVLMTMQTASRRHDRPLPLARRGDRRPGARLGEAAERRVHERAGQHARIRRARERLRSILDSQERIPLIEKPGTRTTTSGGTRRTSAACGGAPRSTSTGSRSPPGRRSSTSTRSPRPSTRTGCGTAPCGSSPTASACLLLLSRGGADAAVVREFDPKTKAFVQDGFTLPEAKSDVVVEGSRHALRRHRLRSRHADRLGLPAPDEGVEARHAADRREPRVRRTETDVAVSAMHDPTPGFERDSCCVA